MRAGHQGRDSAGRPGSQATPAVPSRLLPWTGRKCPGHGRLVAEPAGAGGRLGDSWGQHLGQAAWPPGASLGGWEHLLASCLPGTTELFPSRAMNLKKQNATFGLGFVFVLFVRRVFRKIYLVSFF